MSLAFIGHYHVLGSLSQSINQSLLTDWRRLCFLGECTLQCALDAASLTSVSLVHAISLHVFLMHPQWHMLHCMHVLHYRVAAVPSIQPPTQQVTPSLDGSTNVNQQGSKEAPDVSELVGKGVCMLC